MSGFTVREPTWEEVQNEDNRIHVQMTGDDTWEPRDPLYAKQERALRKYHTADIELRVQEPREIYPLQVRGQASGDLLEQPMTVDPEEDDLLEQPMDIDTVEDLFQPMEETRSVQSAMKEKEAKGKTVTFAAPVAEVMLYDQNAPTTDPFLPLRWIASIGLTDRLVDQGTIDPLDVDSFANALLIEKGMDEELRSLKDMSTTPKRSGFVTAEKLAKNWSIGLEAARRTVESTTQLAVRDFTHTTGGRRLKPYSWILKQKRLTDDVYTDTMFAKCKSLRGNTCSQMYATPFHWVLARPMKSKGEAHYTLDDLFSKHGIPRAMIPDNAKELTEGKFLKKCRKAQCRVLPIEAFTSNANLVEGDIREVKRQFRRVMIEKNIPEVLWDFVIEWVCMTRSNTALNLRTLEGKTPATKMTGDTADISHLAEFGIYDWVWYVSPQGTPGARHDMQRKRLGGTWVHQTTLERQCVEQY